MSARFSARFRDRLRLAERRAQSPYGFHGPQGGFFGGGSRLGLVASRARVPYAFSATLAPMMVRSALFAKDDLGRIKICWANWFANFRNPGPGNVLTVTASVEYPAGVFTQVRFGGAAAGVAPPLTNLWSDFVTVAIPNGAQFWIRSFQSNTIGIGIPEANTNTTLGELLSQPGTDQTMGGTISANLQAWSAPPSAVIGATAKRSIFFIGDSIMSGLYDDGLRASGLLGTLENGLGAAYAFSRNSVSAMRADAYLAGFGSGPADLAQYATDIVNEFGINDLGSGISAANLEITQTSLRALFPAARYHLCTLIPSSTSTDSWITLVNQTPFPQDPQRVLYNSALRANALGFDPIFECANVLESALNSGKTKVDGTPFKYTADGTHPSAFGYNLFASAGFTL